MIKKLIKYGKISIAMALIMALALPSYATVGASDGSAFVTKAEFDAALSDFNARLTTFEAGINSKIDSQVSSYLDRNGIWNAAPQASEVQKSYLKNTAAHLFNWSFWGNDHPVKNGSYVKFKGANYNVDAGMYLDHITKLNENYELTDTLDPLISGGGPHNTRTVKGIEHTTLIDWINEIIYSSGAHKADNTGAALHVETWLSDDRPLFTSNKSGLAFVNLMSATLNGAQQGQTNDTLQNALKGKSSTMLRNAFCFGWKWPAGTTIVLSGGEYNKFLTEKYSVALDFIDRTANPTPATVDNGLTEDALFRYNWFNSVMVPYDSNWYTNSGNLSYLPLGKTFGMQTFAVPAFNTTIQFFVQKNHKYVMRVVGDRDNPYGSVATLTGLGMFYTSWAHPTSYYDMTANVY